MRHIGKRYVLGNRNAFNVLYLYQNQRSFITNTLNFMRRTTLRNLKLLSLSLFYTDSVHRWLFERQHPASFHGDAARHYESRRTK